MMRMLPASSEPTRRSRSGATGSAVILLELPLAVCLETTRPGSPGHDAYMDFNLKFKLELILRVMNMTNCSSWCQCFIFKFKLALPVERLSSS